MKESKISPDLSHISSWCTKTSLLCTDILWKQSWNNFFFLEVLILPSINIFKHFHSKKHQCAQFILVCWFHLCKKTSFIILYLTQYLKFACKDSWITSSTIVQYFCLKFLFFHCPIIKTFEINVKKEVPRFLQKYVSTRVYNGKNPSIQNVSEHPEQFNIKIQVPLSCVHTY